jgi:hypothetical protein
MRSNSSTAASAMPTMIEASSPWKKFRWREL